MKSNIFTFGLLNLRFRKSTFILYGIVSIFSVPSRLMKKDSSFTFFLACLGIGILITSLTLPILWIVSKINQNVQKKKNSLAFPLVLILTTGAFRGLILHNLIKLIGLEDNLRPIWAIFSSTIFTFIYFTIISSFIESVLQRRERFDQVFSEASLLLSDPNFTSQSLTNSKNLYDSVLNRLKQKISPLQIDSDSIDSEKLLAASQVIQNEINQVLRPLSHRLWINSMGQIKHKNFLGILRNATENLEFNTLKITTYQLVIGGYGISLVLGPISGISLSLIAVATSLFIIALYRFAIRRNKVNRFFLGSAFLLCEGLFPVFVPFIFHNPFNDSASLLNGLIIAPTLPGIILLLSSYQLIVSDRELAIGAASSVGWRIASKNSNMNEVKDGIELAEYFHNSLQSEFFGLAKRLEKASTGTEELEHRNIVKSLENVLNRNYEDISSQEMDGVMRIENIVNSWKGIADIEIFGMQNLEPNSALAFRISQFIEELVTNTIRYGQASKLVFGIELHSNRVNLSLSHNGAGAVSKRAGLGSILMAQYSQSGVKIESNEGTTKVSLDIVI